jgi:hypothetical protein
MTRYTAARDTAARDGASSAQHYRLSNEQDS